MKLKYLFLALMCLVSFCGVVNATTYSDNLIPTMVSATSPSGAVICSPNPSGYYGYYAFDKSTSTRWINSPGGVTTIPCYIGYQFDTAHNIEKYTILPRSDSPTYSASAWIFQGSNDGSTWTDLDTQTGITSWTSEKKVFEFTNSVDYYYYRIYITSSADNNFVHIAEIEMMEATISYPVAEFSASPTSTTPGTSITFTDSSTNTPTSWFWEFGDGDTSTLQNPTHSYSNIGTYSVNLTATNVDGSDYELKVNYITIGNAPVAAFSGTPISGYPGLSVSFTDSSTNTPTSWNWNFGDGDTSTSQNPSHTYAFEGTFTVTLNSTNAFGYDLETKTDYITVSYGPTAAFSASPTSTTAGTSISFTDSSTGSPVSWYWNFGDGDTSTSQNPTHSYSSTGTYTVSLNVTDGSSMSDVETKTDYITIGNPPVASFTGTPTTGASAPLEVTFTDSSTNSPTSWSWNFGDGNTSTSQNPVHTYNLIGAFNVTLTATNAFGSDTETKTNYIGIGDPIADFSVDDQTLIVGATATFTDLSVNNPISWSWTFGDGDTSTSQNPTHSYSAEGTYTVSLTITNAIGSDSETKTDYISVGYIPVAAFSGDPLTASVGPLDVTFTDASTGTPTSWSWTFGDGDTSTSQNPTHSYTTSGDMTVSLTVSNVFGSDTETKTDYITVPSLMRRPRATATIAPVSTESMQSIVNALGGDSVYQVDQGVDWSGLIGSSFGEYEEILGANILCIIIWSLPFIAIVIMHGRIEIPLLIGIFFGVIIIAQLPADLHYLAWIFIIVGILGVFAKAIFDYKRW